MAAEQHAMSRLKPKLPTLYTIEELAAFWDTHDVTEFLSELEVVPEGELVFDLERPADKAVEGEPPCEGDRR